MRRVGSPEVVRVDEASPESSFRELDDAFLQRQTKIWLGEVLHLRFGEEILVADLLADGELLFQVSKVIWKILLKKNKEQLKQSNVYIYERTSFGKSNGRYMPYPKVDSFLKICQILGLTGIDLFTPSDVVEKRDVRKVCMCIRSLSKKAQLMQLNVPDFDIVTYTIAMPNYIVRGIRRNLELSQCSSSSSSGYSPRTTLRALHRQRIFAGQNDHHDDTHYDSDEAESRLFVLEPGDSIDEDSFDMLLHLSNAPQVEMEGYGESLHDMHHEEQSTESVESLNAGTKDAGSMDSTPLMCNKESSCSTQSQTDQCSRTRTTIKCPLSLEGSDSISTDLGSERSKDDLDALPATISIRIYEGHVENSDCANCHQTRLSSSHISPDQEKQENGKTFAVPPGEETNDIQKDKVDVDLYCESEACDRSNKLNFCEKDSAEETNGSNGSCSGLVAHNASNGTNFLQFGSDIQADTLVCDTESVGSSSEQLRFGLDGELSDLTLSSQSYSELTSKHTTDDKVQAVSEDFISGIFLSPEAYFPNALECCPIEVTPNECFASSCSTETIATNMKSKESLEKKYPTSSPEEQDYKSCSSLVTESIKFRTLPLCGPSGEVLTPSPNDEVICLSSADQEPIQNIGASGKNMLVTIQSGCDVSLNKIEPRSGVSLDKIEPSLDNAIRMLDYKHTKWAKELPAEHGEVQQDITEHQLSVEQDQLLPETEKNGASGALKPEHRAMDQMDAAQCEDKSLASEGRDENSSAVQRTANSASKSGTGVLKSVASGITIVGAVFFILHLRRSRERNFTTVVPSLSEKSIHDSSRAKNVDKGKAATVYPGDWLKV